MDPPAEKSWPATMCVTYSNLREIREEAGVVGVRVEHLYTLTSYEVAITSGNNNA